MIEYKTYPIPKKSGWYWACYKYLPMEPENFEIVYVADFGRVHGLKISLPYIKDPFYNTRAPLSFFIWLSDCIAKPCKIELL
jgi:hypothetical protein